MAFVSIHYLMIPILATLLASALDFTSLGTSSRKCQYMQLESRVS